MTGSRLLPLPLALCALLASAAGLEHGAFYLELISIPGAAAAAFVAVADVLEGRRALARAVSGTLALTLLVVGSAVRENAPHGMTPAPLATYALVGAIVAYALPALLWVLEPRRPRRRPARVSRHAAAEH